jgi:23S rRNA pseudouridine1911/1915/1917 synthase
MSAGTVFKLGDGEEGLRLDVWLKGAVPHWSRGGIRTAIEGGRVRVDGHEVHRGRILHAGETVQVLDLPGPDAPAVAPDDSIPLVVRMEDEDLLVLDKPAGLPTHPSRPGERPTLAGALLAHYPALAGVCKDALRPGLPDSLETECSGLVLAAKNPAAYSALRGRVQRHEIARTCLALVRGDLSETIRIPRPMVRDPSRRGRMIALTPGRPWVGEKPMHAATELTPVADARGLTLVRATFSSNVPHQVRCHAAAAGYPLAGDELYGRGASGGPDFLLHRSGLELAHPVTGEPLHLHCALPAAQVRRLKDLGMSGFEDEPPASG